MGCGPSKLIKKNLKRRMILDNGGNFINHEVSLKSSTYGVLNFDNETQQQEEICVPLELEEVINVWELMQDLEEDGFIERSSDSRKGVIGNDVRSSLKLLNQIVSPLKVMKCGGKSDGVDSVLGFPSCFSPSFDPELIALYEKELSEEEEEIKRMIENSKTETEIGKWDESHGSNEVVIYTTTLGGNQKTFEECNTVRSIIESHRVQTFECDVLMNTGFKEELRKLMGSKEVEVPLVFVEGKLIGGVEEIVKLENEGKLGMLFDGILPRAVQGCNGELKQKIKCGECNENGLIQCPICC